MTSGIRRAYLMSVLDALSAYAAGGGELHFASINDRGKLTITITLEDGDAYNAQVTALFNKRFAEHEATTPGADGASPRMKGGW